MARIVLVACQGDGTTPARVHYSHRRGLLDRHGPSCPSSRPHSPGRRVRLTGTPDADVFAAALATEHALLTENLADFTRLAAEHSAAGGHHSGLLIALPSRFSRRPAGTGPLVAAIQAVIHEQLDDRVVYLERRD